MPVAVAGDAPVPKFHEYVAEPVVPVDVLVKVVVAPEQTDVEEAEKFASIEQPERVIAKVIVEPIQPLLFVSCTVTLPLFTPNDTVIELVPAPAVIVAPEGTVHA
jgi:hypothetical protein